VRKFSVGRFGSSGKQLGHAQRRSAALLPGDQADGQRDPPIVFERQRRWTARESRVALFETIRANNARLESTIFLVGFY